MIQPPSIFQLPRFIPQTSKHYHNVSIYKLLNWSILNVFSPYHFQMQAIISKVFLTHILLFLHYILDVVEPFLIVLYVVIGMFLGVFATGFGVQLCLQNGQIRGKCCCPRRREPLGRVTIRNTSFLSIHPRKVCTLCVQLFYLFQIQLQHTHMLTNFFV